MLQRLLSIEVPASAFFPTRRGRGRGVLFGSVAQIVFPALCTFLDRSLVLQLMQAESLSVLLLPVMAEDNFRIPGSSHEIFSTDLDGRDVTALVGKLFQKIAVHVSPQDAEDVLVRRVAIIARRIVCELGESAQALHSVSSESLQLHRIVPRDGESLTDEKDLDLCGQAELVERWQVHVDEQPTPSEGGMDVRMEPILILDEGSERQ